ncbi:SDR family NAD(P)-dependent oxidoreductase [Luteimonas sp. BDR2-5]|uniref:SDR family NAD(P)-dependent oxidoreductase n=1 Tax=Proluteimonas luteida TaxID=2878685 RepID=UPI001E530A13|nr:SDR family NAD(P)-dependent oxidoreductase [Luteimonas sp. BDR2-5]MCD9028997.1 SDR family NAD(P)-dependent oxidoreductase [Luteimonas sp. BDR2-5]
MSGRLLVLGATGAVGGAVVARALDAGRQVVAVARDADALRALRARHDDGPALVTLDARVASDADAAALAARIAALPGAPPAVAVAAIRGSIERGRLLDAPADFLRRRLDEDLLPHLFAARHLLPLLAPQPRNGYVLVGGPGADYPWAGYGHHSIGAAALRMLARVLHDEARTLPVRVQMLTVDTPARTAANARQACAQWPSDAAIAQYALEMLDHPVLPASPLVRFPVPPARSGATLSDDIDTAGFVPCLPAARNAAAPAPRDLDHARALLRDAVAAASLPSPQDLPR